MRLFKNRDDAGRQLGAVLAERRYAEPVVLALPRGGVPVALAVARILGCPLGVITARKLRAPGYPELAIGAVTADGVRWVNDDVVRETGATHAYIQSESELQAADCARRDRLFGGRSRPDLAGKTVIIIDDGIATGATAIAAIRSIRTSQASRVLIATPVAPPETVTKLRAEADEVICPFVVSDFFAVGQFYADFRQLDDAEVARTLQEFAEERPRNGAPVA